MNADPDNPPRLLPSLAILAGAHDAIICDVWGVIHDGKKPYEAAAVALARFRAERGPVLLLSNAPRPACDVARHLAGMGVSADAFDMILTSGDATSSELEARTSSGGRLAVLHIGPDRDHGLFADLPIDLVDADRATIVVCSGLYNDESETPDDYALLLARLKARNVPMICANPDHKVERGPLLIFCAGAIAHAYELLGGPAIYFGKPHQPVYQRALAMLAAKAGRPLVPSRVLAIGDALATDITGANRIGLGALLITGGIHATQFGSHALAPDETIVARALSDSGLSVLGLMPRLVW